MDNSNRRARLGKRIGPGRAEKIQECCTLFWCRLKRPGKARSPLGRGRIFPSGRFGKSRLTPVRAHASVPPYRMLDVILPLRTNGQNFGPQAASSFGTRGYSLITRAPSGFVRKSLEGNVPGRRPGMERSAVRAKDRPERGRAPRGEGARSFDPVHFAFPAVTHPAPLCSRPPRARTRFTQREPRLGTISGMCF